MNDFTKGELQIILLEMNINIQRTPKQIAKYKLGYDCDYIGGWSTGEPTEYEDLLEALLLVDEWGFTNQGRVRVRNRIGIYDSKEDSFYDTRACISICDYMRSLGI